MSDESNIARVAVRAAHATPPDVIRRVRGLSDRGIAWLFVTPT
ncbi:MAG: sugar ABC transporter permease, partial [Gammaproteobacteria bacterium]